MLRKQGKIRFAGDLKSLAPGQTCIAISSIRSKKFSFMVQVLEVEKDPSVKKIPILEVDKYLSGILSGGDLVELFPYNLPEATKLLVGVSDKLIGVTPGDWTATLKEPLMGNPYDLGDQVKAAVSSGSAGGVMIIRGKVLNTHPKAPVTVGSGTQIVLKKFSESKLIGRRNQMEQMKADRADELKDVIRADLIDIIAQTKTELTMHSESFDFDSSDPMVLNQTITGMFAGYQMIDDTLVNNPDNFSSSRSYVVRDQTGIKEIIEIQITAAKDHGTVLIRLYSESIARARDFAYDIKSNLRSLGKGLKEEATSVNTECPFCGGDLDVNQVDAEGNVWCMYCQNKSALKKVY
jgi:hypothetical protein